MHLKHLLTISLLTIVSLTFAQNNWKLIYENDAEGNSIKGELNGLITSIRKGEVIRIYFTMGDKSKRYVEHTTLVKFSSILNSSQGQFVTAQIDPIVGQIPDFTNGKIILKENLEWSLIASTSGKNDQMTRNMHTGEIMEHSIRKWGTKWYVQKD